MRGGSVDVTLKAAEGRANPLRYELVSLPQHGRLGDIRQADTDRQTSASIVYTHGDDEDSISDEFTFKARSLVGGGVSSPIKVKLQIVDAPPQLQVTPRADFSSVAGESDRQQIILANVGGGLIEGRVAPKDPFHVEGEDRFSLGRGAMTNIVIRFSPTRTESVGPQKLAPAPADPGATITLRGEVSAPFEASAEPLKVDATGARSGLIVISNLASAPLAVDLELTPKGAAEVSSREEIPPQSTAQIPVTISSEKAGGAFNLNVALSSPFHRQDVTFEVPAVPPRLELVTPELDFRGSNEAAVVVKNSGGTEGRFDLGLPPDVKSLSKTQTFAVAARTNTSVSLRWERSDDECADDATVKTAGLSKNLDVLRPARLKVVTGKLDFRKSVEAELVLTNSGDAAGRFVLALPPGLEAGDQSQKWEVPARGEISVQLRQISPDTRTEGRPVSVDLGNEGTTVVPVVVAEVPPGWPWQLNEDIRMKRMEDNTAAIAWLSSKDGWTNAHLEIVDGSGARPYTSAAHSSGDSWFKTISLKISAAIAWLKNLGNYFNRRTALAGEEQQDLAEDTAENRKLEWREITLAPDDLQNPKVCWRVVARRQGNPPDVVSDHFRPNASESALTTACSPFAVKAQQGSLPMQITLIPARQLVRRSEGSKLTLVVALVGADEATDYALHRVNAIKLVPEAAGVLYDTAALPSTEGRVLPKLPEDLVQAVNLGLKDVPENLRPRIVAIEFEKLERGSSMLCQLKPSLASEARGASEPFAIDGPPAKQSPLAAALLTVALAILVWLAKNKIWR